MDINGSVVLLAGLFVLSLMGRRWSTAWRARCATRSSGSREPGSALSARGLETLMMSTLQTLAYALAPVALVCVVAAVVANVGQVGLRAGDRGADAATETDQPAVGREEHLRPENVLRGRQVDRSRSPSSA